MKEQVKGILFDFKDAGWTVQKVEKTLGFSNGSLGKPISEYRFHKLLELHKNEIKKQPTVYGNSGNILRQVVNVTDLTKPNKIVEPQEPFGSKKSNYSIDTTGGTQHPLRKEGDPKEGTMGFYSKYGCMAYDEISKK